MKPTPLLDFWQKPAGAGEPLAMFATTFALDPDFFEQSCLARFLEVSSVDEGARAVDDLVGSVELHDLLRRASITVLADRSAPVNRSSLLWDLLSCKVEHGLLHAKVTVLIWENATRVILGSANLTAAGYRRQIELGLAADLGPQCLFPPNVLEGIADELDTYLYLVPGFDANTPVFKRAKSTLQLLRKRIEAQQAATARGNPSVLVAFAPTNATRGPLDQLHAVWSGPQPLRATHLSPFWDAKDASVLLATKKLLTGRPASKRSHRVAVVLGPCGQTAFSKLLAEAVNEVRVLKELDKETRLLHAKCLLIESDIESGKWVAALVGSSNHTKAGLGLKPHGRHREMNVWIGAPRDSKEGKALLDLIQLGKAVPADAEEVDPLDEDECELASLPACFGLTRVNQNPQTLAWELHLGIAQTTDMPSDWEICLVSGAQPMLTRSQWAASGSPASTVIALAQDSLPMYLLVHWEGQSAPWGVVADERQSLPLGPTLSGLNAQQLLDALASGLSVSQMVRQLLERAKAQQGKKGTKSEAELDPLKRHDVHASLLRKGRALGAALSGMQRRLERPVVDADALRMRLAGPLSPAFVATKLAEAFVNGVQTRAETVFTIAEIALTVGRVKWSVVLGANDCADARKAVLDTFSHLDGLRVQIGGEGSEIASYAGRAIEEGRKCLTA